MAFPIYLPLFHSHAIGYFVKKEHWYHENANNCIYQKFSFCKLKLYSFIAWWAKEILYLNNIKRFKMKYRPSKTKCRFWGCIADEEHYSRFENGKAIKKLYRHQMMISIVITMTNIIKRQLGYVILVISVIWHIFSLSWEWRIDAFSWADTLLAY